MEPGQYTGKSDATQGDPSSGAQTGGGDTPSSAPQSTPPAGTNMRPSAPTGARRAGSHGGAEFLRIVIWVAVLVGLVGGLVMYFRYERAVVPLIGGGR
jgi:hypothetical protein